MGNQILGSDKIVRINNFSLLGLVQSQDWAPNFNAQDIQELGRVSRVDTAFELETSGSLELESQGNTPGLLARMIPKRTAGSFLGFLYSGTAAGTNKNAYTISETDVLEAQFDIVMHERPDQTNYTRSTYIPRAYPQSISGRVDANGMAMETINWAGQEAYGFDTPYHDIVALPCTRTTATTATLVNNDEVTVSATSHTLIYFYVDEQRYRTVVADGNYATFATSIVTLVGGATIPAGAILRAVCYKTTSPSTTFPSLLDARRGTVAFYVKGYQADLFLAVSDENNPTTAERLLKVQSADYSIDLNSQPLRQIAKNTAGTSIYCRVPTTPFNVSLNISVYESDWAEWKRLLKIGGTNPKFPASGNDVYSDSYDFAPSNLLGDTTNPLKAVLRYYTKNGNTLQTLQMTDLRLESFGERVAVGGRAEVTIGLRGTKFTFVGANPAS